MIFTRIGIYRGRLYAVKKSARNSIDITRRLKKELKVLNSKFYRRE